MITYLFYLALFFAVILPVIYLIKRNPDLSFWLFLNMFSDPGGYFTYYFGGRFLSVLTLSDLMIIPIIFCLYSSKTNYKIIYKDQFFINFLKVFSIFAVYYFTIYGAIVPYLNNDLNYALFLQKNRSFFYYVIILIATYVFALRGLKYFYFTTLFIGLFVLIAFGITLVSGLNLIPIEYMERYEGEEMQRIFILSWGLFPILFNLSFILFISTRSVKLNVKYGKLLYIAGILMVITLLISLSRKYFISIPAALLITILISSYIFRKSSSFAIAKIVIPFVIILFILNLTLPKYLDYIEGIAQDTFQLLTVGKDTRGEEEYRVSGTSDLEITKKYIKENFILGTGYSYLYWGPKGYASSSRGPVYAAAADAAGEVPIYYIFFGYGLIGVIIMIFLYSFIIRIFFRLYSSAKKKINYLIGYPYEILFVIFILYWIADKFTFNLYSLGIDFVESGRAIFISIGFALLKKLKNISSVSDVISNNKHYTDELSVQELSIK